MFFNVIHCRQLWYQLNDKRFQGLDDGEVP